MEKHDTDALFERLDQIVSKLDQLVRLVTKSNETLESIWNEAGSIASEAMTISNNTRK